MHKNEQRTSAHIVKNKLSKEFIRSLHFFLDPVLSMV